MMAKKIQSNICASLLKGENLAKRSFTPKFRTQGRSLPQQKPCFSTFVWGPVSADPTPIGMLVKPPPSR